jgi:hypothetical protein
MPAALVKRDDQVRLAGVFGLHRHTYDAVAFRRWFEPRMSKPRNLYGSTVCGVD